jgi:enamine deaminase RidA (YjgF/YER057c/UK114 family)
MTNKNDSEETLLRRAVRAPAMLNEAYDYPRPSSFSRGMRVDFGEFVMVFLSGTASLDEMGRSIHIGDFRAQTRRTFANLAALLSSEGLSWKDVVRTTCYLRDIERDYEVFNEERTAFYKSEGISVLPASTGVQAILCRPELLVEIEAIAICKLEKPRGVQEG